MQIAKKTNILVVSKLHGQSQLHLLGEGENRLIRDVDRNLMLVKVVNDLFDDT